MENLNNFIQSNLTFVLGGFSLLFSIFIIWNILLQFKLKRQKNSLLSKENADNLEKMLDDQTKNIKLLDKDIQELYSISNQINNLAAKSLSRIGMVRFNPFKDIGGDQSFSLALLNGKNNGFLISSLYTREGTRIYCKAITDGKTEKHLLTEEEEKAIEFAVKQEPKKI
jgi:hypothetical protein